jgi:hypothetical protein
MSYFLEHPELFEQVLRLTREEKEQPIKVIEDFFNGYRLYECRELLWNMVECCLTTENTAFAEAGERDVLLQYFKDLEGMLEAAWLLAGGGKDPKQTARRTPGVLSRSAA